MPSQCSATSQTLITPEMSDSTVRKKINCAQIQDIAFKVSHTQNMNHFVLNIIPTVMQADSSAELRDCVPSAGAGTC